jgi:triacylglycerol lipase
MISMLNPKELNIQSLTTICTPHRYLRLDLRRFNIRGSPFADYVLSYFVAPEPVSSTLIPEPPPFFRFLQSLGIQTAAFQDLTTTNMKAFNNLVRDRDDIRYYSFGASFKPTWGSVFRASHDIIEEVEGENDGLVSVKSAIWGEYKGTLQNVNHLDIINWVSPPFRGC